MRENIFLQYVEWHFADAPRGILRAWKNCLKFNLDYWSILILIKTLFSPWRRHQSSYGKGFDFKKFFDVWTFNVISRFWGAIFRSFLIVLGIFAELLVVFIGAVLFLLWIILPLLSALGFIYGFKFLF